jgi:hypothetical protein
VSGAAGLLLLLPDVVDRDLEIGGVQCRSFGEFGEIANFPKSFGMTANIIARTSLPFRDLFLRVARQPEVENPLSRASLESLSMRLSQFCRAAIGFPESAAQSLRHGRVPLERCAMVGCHWRERSA